MTWASLLMGYLLRTGEAAATNIHVSAPGSLLEDSVKAIRSGGSSRGSRLVSRLVSSIAGGSGKQDPDPSTLVGPEHNLGLPPVPVPVTPAPLVPPGEVYLFSANQTLDYSKMMQGGTTVTLMMLISFASRSGMDAKLFLFLSLGFTVLGTALLYVCWYKGCRPRTRVDEPKLLENPQESQNAFVGGMAPIDWKCCPGKNDWKWPLSEAGVSPCLEAYCCTNVLYSEVWGKAVGKAPHIVGAVLLGLFILPLIPIFACITTTTVKGVHVYSYPENTLWLPTWGFRLIGFMWFLLLCASCWIRMSLQRLGRNGQTKDGKTGKDCCEAFWCHVFCSPCSIAQEAAFFEAVERTDGVLPEIKKEATSDWDKLEIW